MRRRRLHLTRQNSVRGGILLVTGLFVLGYSLYIYGISAACKAMQHRVQKTLSAQCTIGGARFSLMRGFIFENVRIEKPLTFDKALTITCSEITLSYTTEDILKRRFMTPRLITVTEGYITAGGALCLLSSIDGVMHFRDTDTLIIDRVSTKVNGSPLMVAIEGEVSALTSAAPQITSTVHLIMPNPGKLGTFSFNGTWPLFTIAGTMTMPSGGEIALKGTLEKDAFKATITVDHARIYDQDVVTRLSLEGTFLPETDDALQSFRGQFSTDRTIVNFVPFQEWKGQLCVVGPATSFELYTLNESYRLQGAMTMQEPYPLEVYGEFKQIKLEDLCDLFLSQFDQTRSVSGTLDGVITVSGTVREPLSSGDLKAYQGRLKTVEYDYANFNFTGQGSMIVVKDSRITKGERVLIVNGYVDLTRLGDKGWLKTLVVTPAENSLYWKGWDITRRGDNEALNMEKQVDDRVSVGITTYMNDETMVATERREGEVAFECRFDENKSFKFQTSGDDEFFGIQHKQQF